MANDNIQKGFNKYASAINMALLIGISVGVFNQSSNNKIMLAERGVWMAKKDEADARRDREIKILEIELDERAKSRFTKEDGNGITAELILIKKRIRELEKSIWRLKPTKKDE